MKLAISLVDCVDSRGFGVAAVPFLPVVSNRLFVASESC